MRCNSCKRSFEDVVNDSTGKSYCKPCFERLIERRVKKELRGLPRSGVCLIKENTAPNILLKQLLKIPFDEVKDYANYGTVILSLTCEELGINFLDDVFSGKIKEQDSRFVMPLANVSLQECETYCKLKGLNFISKKKSDSVGRFFLSKINPLLEQSLSKFVQKLFKY